VWFLIYTYDNLVLLLFNCAAKDGLKSQLCHAPIPPHYVKDTLSKNGLKSDGNFLIRESRNQHSAYTLSLCYNGSVMCYRIAYDPKEGFSFQDPNSEEEGHGSAECHKLFPTLLDLVQHHEKVTVSEILNLELVCLK